VFPTRLNKQHIPDTGHAAVKPISPHRGLQGWELSHRSQTENVGWVQTLEIKTQDERCNELRLYAGRHTVPNSSVLSLVPSF